MTHLRAFPVPQPQVLLDDYDCQECRDTGFVIVTHSTPEGRTYTVGERCHPGCPYLEGLTKRTLELAQKQGLVPTFEEPTAYEDNPFDEEP